MKNEEELEKGRFSTMSRGLGTVTKEMVWKRAREIAVINGRGENRILDSDVEQARRELTIEEPIAGDPSAEEQTPESQRWDPASGSEGDRTPPLPVQDEQTFAERLVQEGVSDAEHDQMVRATRQSLKRDTEDQ